MRNIFQKIYTRVFGSVLFFILLPLVFIVTLWQIDTHVASSSKELVFSNISSVPYNKVGLLLGTAKYVNTGIINPYYQYRINAAVELFEAGKIDLILASGDNGTIYYNEPTTIKKDLVKRGIPEDRIYLDYAGFRTLDSIIRSNKIFGQNSITVISQKFHNERATYIAKKKNIAAVGFNAVDVAPPYGTKIKIREKFARVLMIFDLIFKTEPKFLGEKIDMEIPESKPKEKPETL